MKLAVPVVVTCRLASEIHPRGRTTRMDVTLTEVMQAMAYMRSAVRISMLPKFALSVGIAQRLAWSPSFANGKENNNTYTRAHAYTHALIHTCDGYMRTEA